MRDLGYRNLANNTIKQHKISVIAYIAQVRLLLALCDEQT